jgi:hypothetical protein
LLERSEKDVGVEGRFSEGEEGTKGLRAHAGPGGEAYEGKTGQRRRNETGRRGRTVEVLPFRVLTHVHGLEMILNETRAGREVVNLETVVLSSQPSIGRAGEREPPESARRKSKDQLRLEMREEQ